MTLPFFKYQGAGNDFILFDNRKGDIRLTTGQVAALCHRRFGIGADGLMLLETAADADFHMVYYNADGHESTMCGNGGRCITAFAARLGLIRGEAVFTAVDGRHRAALLPDGRIRLHMQDVGEVRHEDGFAILNTGSPHYVKWVADTQSADVFREGRAIRNQPEFQPKGINVNFVQRLEDGLRVRTYERGVEDETMSCGTGVTAAAIAASGAQTGSFHTSIETPGGQLEVTFVKDTPHSAREVVLTGPAAFVFEGVITV
jgi:diaminopimelate epimerase